MRFPGLPRLPVSRRRHERALDEIKAQRAHHLATHDMGQELAAEADRLERERDEAQVRVAELDQAIRGLPCYQWAGRMGRRRCGECEACRAQEVLDGHDRQERDQIYEPGRYLIRGGYRQYGGDVTTSNLREADGDH